MSRLSAQSWHDLRLSDMFYAFRKAKADCFFDRSVNVAAEFVAYEANLPANLEALLTRLRAGDIGKLLKENLGLPRLMAKKLGLKEASTPVKGSRRVKQARRGMGSFQIQAAPLIG
jgi:hypothetical protein